MSENNDVWKLERHQYAPELNKLHLRDGRVLKTPGCVDIFEAVEYAEKRGLFEKKLKLIERVEKAIQDAGIIHRELLEANLKMFSVVECDPEGEPNGAFLGVVMPNGSLGIYRCEKIIEL